MTHIHAMLCFTQKGGNVKEKKLSPLNDLVGYDVIINCSGLVAGKLVNDENIRCAWPSGSFEGTMD